MEIDRKECFRIAKILQRAADKMVTRGMKTEALEVREVALKFAVTYDGAKTLEFSRGTIAEVVDAVCKEFDLYPSQLKSRGRSRRLSTPRSAAVWILRNLCKRHITMQEIADEFFRDHTTIIHAYQRFEEDVKTNDSLAMKTKAAIARLNEQGREIKEDAKDAIEEWAT